ncbi:hypothetical protein [Marinobacter sp. DUT-1]|uniref:hypothetical protein n=1 Tax=Marinobacter sp. DUT-1 TaxID=3412037 RepID=UPI003D1689DA
MKKYRTPKVFVPGGMPKLTYVPREAINLEVSLRNAVENLHKLITVTGQTKSGKTVLVNTVLPRANVGENIWIDGGSVDSENDFWTSILHELGESSTFEQTNSASSTKSVEGEVQGGINVPLVADLKGKTQTGLSKGDTAGTAKKLELTPRTAALRALRDFDGSIIVDDFHYLDRDFQGSVIRALKPLIFEGLPVVLIAIPHRRYDAVKVEREMTGRIEDIEVPSWTGEELEQIARTGFPLLRIKLASGISKKLSSEAYGSPHLMQEFCQRLALREGVTETVRSGVTIYSVPEGLFRQVAEGTGKVIYDKLSKGPRQRSDRIQRELSQGGTADIYGVVLKALSVLSPGLETVDYEQLRSAIRQVLNEAPPQAHEVTRVLERIADIAANDEASTPVIDWEKDEQKLHITDPFFAFYLKWGAV